MEFTSVTMDARPSALQLDVRKTGVLVVDMQQGFFGTGGAWNRQGVDVRLAQVIIVPIARVLAVARKTGMPIIYATMDLDGPSDPGALPDYWTEERRLRWVAAGAPSDPAEGGGHLALDLRESDILPELAPQPGDMVIVKPRHSAFYRTELDAKLKELGVTTLIFTGGTTSICVESTLRDAFFHDYRCLLLADCTAEPIGSRLPRTNRDATILLVELVYGWVGESEVLVQALTDTNAVAHVAHRL
jgi:ureidoacrylate peracid hydrolase